MKTDKDLIREGNYIEALGDNYNPTPYSIIPFDKNNQPLNSVSGFSSFNEAETQAEKNNYHNYIIYNANADWL